MISNLKLYIIILIIIYIYLTISIYSFFCCNNKEHFTGLLDLFTDNNNIISNKPNQDVFSYFSTPENNRKLTLNDPVYYEKIEEIKKPKKQKKYIYISKVNYNSSIIKYNIYNKNNNKYLNIFVYNDNNNINKILIRNISNDIIGKNKNNIHNKITINCNLFDNDIILQYYNKYQSIKIYLENDDKIFYINKNIDNNFTIDLYSLNIGKTIYKDDMYKIIVIEDYKKYLNLFAIGIILLIHF